MSNDIKIEDLTIVNLENAKNEIPKTKGIYFWFDKTSNEMVYIGIGAGTKGLYNRIVRQHMNPKYIEYRGDKHSSKDQFQLSCPIQKMVKGELKNGIDQSAFRKNIGRSLEIKPGEGTVGYIHTNLYLKIMPIKDPKFIKQTEKELIKKYQPKFNVSHK